VKGRKRHLLVDTQGLVLKVVVSAADVQDRDGARLVAKALRLYGPEFPRLSLVWADAA
jgi:putative transposase